MANEPPPSPDRPRPGLIYIDDAWHVRRHGLLVQRRLKCIFGHKITMRPRPFEVAIPCDSMGDPYMFEGQLVDRCNAHLYLFTTRARLLWVMDVTVEESQYLADKNIDAEQIVSHFGCGFPVDHKILRRSAA
jgi:hypothetical protein